MKFTKEGLKYAKDVMNPIKFKFAMMAKLPSVSYWGVKVLELNERQCSVRIPFKHATKNPFKSIYFAAQAGAGELSTGLLVDSMLRGRGKWSMLVLDYSAKFTKKATGDVVFTCVNGPEIAAAVEEAETNNAPALIDVETVGTLSDGQVVSRMKLQWSIKKKTKK